MSNYLLRNETSPERNPFIHLFSHYAAVIKKYKMRKPNKHNIILLFKLL